MGDSAPRTSAARLTDTDVVRLGARNGLELAIRQSTEKTVGKVITQVSSPDLISGVLIEPLQIFADDRGFFAELARLGNHGIAEHMMPGGKRQVQISTTLTYPGAIKAIHYHFEQTDLWFPLSGMFQVLLYDFRQNSPTSGRINTLYVGTYRQWAILIPPGVGHGYKVVGPEPAMLVYVTNRFYNPQDEGRLAYDHPAVGYDWETQHK